MKSLLNPSLALLTFALVTSTSAKEKSIKITVGQPISIEAQEVLEKFKKSGFELETHTDGRSSTVTSTRCYRSPHTGDFIQIITLDDTVQRLYWIPAATTEADYWKTEFQKATQISITPNTLRVNADPAIRNK